VSGDRGETELSAAVSLGASSLSTKMVDDAIYSGGEILEAVNIDGVYRSLAEVLEAYSPSESDRIASYRLIP
jgi:tRNA G37 N-methylase TrmD